MFTIDNIMFGIGRKPEVLADRECDVWSYTNCSDEDVAKYSKILTDYLSMMIRGDKPVIPRFDITSHIKFNATNLADGSLHSYGFSLYERTYKKFPPPRTTWHHGIPKRLDFIVFADNTFGVDIFDEDQRQVGFFENISSFDEVLEILCKNPIEDYIGDD